MQSEVLCLGQRNRTHVRHPPIGNGSSAKSQGPAQGRPAPGAQRRVRPGGPAETSASPCTSRSPTAVVLKRCGSCVLAGTSGSSRATAHSTTPSWTSMGPSGRSPSPNSDWPWLSVSSGRTRECDGAHRGPGPATHLGSCRVHRAPRASRGWLVMKTGVAGTSSEREFPSPRSSRRPTPCPIGGAVNPSADARPRARRHGIEE